MRPKARSNGEGTAYKRKGRPTWTAQVIVGYKQNSTPGGQPVPIKRTKAGFKTKKEAIQYCSVLLAAPTSDCKRLTLNSIYEEWKPFYSPRVTASTMECYRSAFLHFKKLHSTYIDLITAHDLQQCLDACPQGKRTHQNMKCIARLLWAYALDKQLIDKDVTEHLYIGKHDSVQREPLTDHEVELIAGSVGKMPYADYIYCLCFLGFRPGELLALRKDDFRSEAGLAYLVGGSKTEAGRDRKVPVPNQIIGIIRNRLAVDGTDLLFPQYCYDRKNNFTGFKQMSHAYFRESVFKPIMVRLGIAKGKVPYCARHTYSDKLKRAKGTDKAKASLMGHTDYAFTQNHYQSTDLKDLKTIAKSISSGR